MIDKSRWGPGPWQSEPDRLEFHHRGFPCLIRRSNMGNLCGYVAVPEGHPWYGKPYDDLDAISVHGGVTYSSRCQGEICHVPALGESDDVFWLGFDCAHYNDAWPVVSAIRHLEISGEICTYKDIAFVRAECERLAEQAAGAR